MRAKVLFSLVGALIAAVALVSASGAATTKTHKAARIDLSTRAAVIHYLHSIHVNPKGAVIQRGGRNYAGARCPARGWTCASTRHTVVQIATVGGKNTFSCTTSKCAVVQIAIGALSTNSAKCIKTSGLLQACAIVQSSSSANNLAVVYEKDSSSGILQTAASGAAIVQRATGASNTNTACVYQEINLTGSKTVSSGSLNIWLGAHQDVTIKQDSAHGANSASSSATSGGACDTGHSLTQTQTLSSIAKGPGAITQNENSASLGPNVLLDIEQNQSSGFKGSATGTNSAVFSQTNNLQAVANTLNGPVSQTQSSPDTNLPYSGLVGTLNQDSRGISTASATQTETQCEDAATSGLTVCDTSDGDAPPYTLTQTQYGPEGIWKAPNHPRRHRRVPFVHKGYGTTTQTGNGSDTFTINQSSKQDTDQGAGSTQTNVVQGDCQTSGNCTDNQSTTVDGQTTTNTQSGQNLNSSINCTGSSCQPTVPPAPIIDTKPTDPSGSSSAEFTFHDTQAGVTFLCSLDSSNFSTCSSPTDYSDLSDGSHTFSVEAKDGNGNVGPSTSYTWMITTSHFTTDGNQLTATNVDYAQFGYGGMRGDTGGTNGDGTGSIAVTGITGTVLKALLYWNGPTSSSDPTSNAAVSFADTPITGTNIGTASSNCWNYTNSQSYAADVTSLVAGNGTYGLSDFIKRDGDTITSDINGVALIVFYDDGNSSNDRNVVLWAGNDSNIAFGNDPAGWDETLTGVPGSSSGGLLDLIVSDGQSFGDGAVVVNGTPIVDAGNVFQGDSTPAGPATPGEPGTGSLWDVKGFNLPSSLLAASSNTLEITSQTATDCLSLVAAAANVPAPPPIP